jgi:hypothetical protein
LPTRRYLWGDLSKQEGLCWLLIKKILTIIKEATVVLTVTLLPRVFLFLAPLLQLLVLSLLAIVYVHFLSLSLSQFLSFFKILSHGYFFKIMFVGAWGAFRDFDSKYNNFSFANLSEENSGFMEMQVPPIFESFSSGVLLYFDKY